MNFNLLEEPWIPVLYADGRCERIGIKAALEHAGSIRQIAASNPMDRVALLRFLLAVLYWCKGNPPAQAEKDAVLAAGRFPPDWFAKLDENADCFNLLGDGKRFYQNSKYQHHDPEHTTDYLIHEVPSGTNKWHFRHAMDKVDGLCPACCALGLIRLPVFATSGGRGMSPSTGKSPGINAKPPLYVLPVGPSLLATLLLLWRTPQQELGTPEWETPCDTLPMKGEVPLLTGLTWLPRNVWLANPEEPEAVCASCGRREQLIRLCVFDGKGSSKAEDRIWRDPHVVQGTSKDGEIYVLPTGDALGAKNAGAGQWARNALGILGQTTSGAEERLLVVAFSTVQNDKYLEACESLVLRLSSNQQDPNCVAMLQQWQKEGSKLAHRMQPKSSRKKHLELQSALDAIRPDVEATVSANAEELLSRDGPGWERAARTYRPMMETAAKSLSPGFTTKAVLRRREIAGALPDMTPKPPKASKPKAKKGGEE